MGSVEETRNFLDLAKKANIDQDLKQGKAITVFVSKDDFFGDDFDSVQKKYLLGGGEGKKDLARYLNHQIATGIHYASSFKEGKTVVKTVEKSEDLEVEAKYNKFLPSTLTVNGVKVIHSDILSANGTVKKKNTCIHKKKHFFSRILINRCNSCLGKPTFA